MPDNRDHAGQANEETWKEIKRQTKDKKEPGTERGECFKEAVGVSSVHCQGAEYAENGVGGPFQRALFPRAEGERCLQTREMEVRRTRSQMVFHPLSLH